MAERILVIDDSPTILKVVQLVLTKAGYDVRVAQDGEEGIERAVEFRPQLILLDFVMPKLNGYQVCRALQDSPELKSVPVVLMSAKGEQIGERFVKVMGIVDYITKPFSPDAIVAVVQHSLQKRPSPEGEGGFSAGADFGRDPSDMSTPASGGSGTRDTTVPGSPIMSGLHSGYNARRLDAFAGFREGVAEALTADDMISGEIADKVRSKLDDSTIERLVEPLVGLVPRAGEMAGEEALAGNLKLVPIAEVLGLLAEQQQWGRLEVSRTYDDESTTRVELIFKQGKIELVFAEGLKEEFLVGRYLLAAQNVNADDLELQLRTKGRDPIGTALVKAGLTGNDDVRSALSRQAAERVYEVLKWPSGRFRFYATRELPPLAIDAALGLDVAGVLMEGFRRVDEWHLIEREVDDFDAVYLRNEESVQNLGRARLTREELTVLELVNGKNSIKDIVRLSRMGSFEVSKMLFRLLSIKLVRRRIAPVAV